MSKVPSSVSSSCLFSKGQRLKLSEPLVTGGSGPHKPWGKWGERGMLTEQRGRVQGEGLRGDRPLGGHELRLGGTKSTRGKRSLRFVR